MASNKNVTVLTPNARRPTVKVSPNTILLQILEEVCQKHNFNPDDYDLKHHNRILDVNTVFRFSNIPVNACLEMVPCKVPRKVSNVKICIQLEDGNRQTKEFLPTANIESILNDLSIDHNIETSVIIYMQREIYGKDFATTTLKSLGLGSGTALFRLLQRDLEKLKEQAHVYVPPKPKILKTEEIEIKKPVPVTDMKKNKDFLNPISILKVEKTETIESEKKDNKELEPKNNTEAIADEVCISNIRKQSQEEEEIPMEVDMNNKIETLQNASEEINLENLQVEFLGERDALLFNQADIKPLYHDDLPDEFFELTKKDAQKILRDARKIQSDLEDAPLETSALRELKKDKERLLNLHKYQQSVIRIQFANQLILQGIFKPVETVQSIKDFIKLYLEYPENDFVLYTTPPRCVLETEERLLDLNLVPSAVVYYSGSSDLKSEIKSKLTDPLAANIQAIKTRLATTRNNDSLLVDSEEIPRASTSKLTFVTSSANNGMVIPQASSSKPQSERSKAPKWFKLSKK